MGNKVTDILGAEGDAVGTVTARLAQHGVARAAKSHAPMLCRRVLTLQSMAG
jgi:hypothetical protein